MNRTASVIAFVSGIVWVATGAAFAQAPDPTHLTTKYTMTFTGTGNLPTSGTFEYDNTANRFISFVVVWDGYTLDFTNSANYPYTMGQGPNCSYPATGAQATLALLTACATSADPTGWGGLNDNSNGGSPNPRMYFYGGTTAGNNCVSTPTQDRNSSTTSCTYAPYMQITAANTSFLSPTTPGRGDAAGGTYKSIPPPPPNTSFVVVAPTPPATPTPKIAPSAIVNPALQPNAVRSVAGIPRQVPILSASVCLTSDGKNCLPPNALAPPKGQARHAIVIVSSGGQPVVGVAVSVSGQNGGALTDANGVAVVNYNGCITTTRSPVGITVAIPAPCQGAAAKAGYQAIAISLP